MKNKKRVLILLIVILVINLIVRIGNIGILCLGENSQKNVYATSYMGCCFWDGLDGVEQISGLSMTDVFADCSIHFEKGYELENINKGTWGVLGMFGIHNLADSVEGISFEISQYYVDVYENQISFSYNGKSENDYAYFIVDNNEIILEDDRYAAALEEHKDILDKIIPKSQEYYKDYTEKMKGFCKQAIIFEAIILLISIVLVIVLAKCYIVAARKIAEEDIKSIKARKSNLNYGLIESLLYSAIIEFILMILLCEGIITNFILYCIVYLVPMYVCTSVVIVVIYLIKRKKINENPISNMVYEEDDIYKDFQG